MLLKQYKGKKELELSLSVSLIHINCYCNAYFQSLCMTQSDNLTHGKVNILNNQQRSMLETCGKLLYKDVSSEEHAMELHFSITVGEYLWFLEHNLAISESLSTITRISRKRQYVMGLICGYKFALEIYEYNFFSLNVAPICEIN